MNIVKLKIQVTSISNEVITCLVEHQSANNQIKYHTALKELSIKFSNSLSIIIIRNRFQLKKVLNSALKGCVTVGQNINCVFIEDFPFLNERQFNQFICIDRRHKQLTINASKSSNGSFHKLYTDGSHVCETGHSAYAGLLETPDGHQEIFSRSFDKGSSNLMELLAVIDGMERLQKKNKVQLFTDSRFVIRGLAQWVYFWEHNNWQTAFGAKVKFARYWQELHQLCDGKLMVLKWIKGHSGHEEQSFCHQLARQTAEKQNRMTK
ncbi:ribonuclease HI [Carboxylicivirga sp. A043]|uniref:ribonuclease H family protein n=1 Tax=Carboxylicivirga litoralis TaxID=2816963 RepID=UPI0021CB684F|nr:ribonuclease H [Carboxylicivirga sp. A043]MCU4154559.1 ribonuclease HI [Carboxylicivirga sp. A043]